MVTTLDLGNGSMSYYNATSHSINLFSGAVFRHRVKRFVGGERIAVIPKSGVLLSARLAYVPVEDLGNGITVAKQVAIACDDLPEEAIACDFIVVSAMYATAYRQLYGYDNTRLVTVRDLVVKSEDNPVPAGCRGFLLV